MAATKSQGKSFTLFIVGVTAAAAGIAYFSSGMGKLALIGGLIVLALAFGIFLKIKPDEGAIGWVIVVFGLNLSTSVSGRMTTTLIGIAVSLVGSLVLLPIAANKNAIWKA
jgi:hypothetical protein